MSPIDPASAEHYTWGGVCDGWHLVKRPEMSVILERVPPGARETRHLHSVARQFFFVLRGEAVLEVGGARVTASAGQGVEVPPGAPHQFLNESSEPVEFLVFSHPTTRGDRAEV